jgi:hypothetical protein
LAALKSKKPDALGYVSGFFVDSLTGGFDAWLRG